jgi:diaminopimelate epimerase
MTNTVLRFSKMHGLGNDFVVIDAINQSVSLTTEQIRFLADRQFGIGCDQLLLVEAPSDPAVDFRYRIFNADGSEVEQCGNGARCFVRFVHDKGLTDKSTITVETASGIIYPTLIDDSGLVCVDMGEPEFEPRAIPFEATARSDVYQLTVDAYGEVAIQAVSMGNPHAVIRVEDVYTAPVEQLGALIESHPRFPQRVNVGFMQIMDAQHVRLRVFERGAGETLACGTGACAAAVSGIQRGWLQSPVSVTLPGGELTISWSGEGQSVLMTGPTAHVFDGEIAWSTLQNIR